MTLDYKPIDSFTKNIESYEREDDMISQGETINLIQMINQIDNLISNLKNYYDDYSNEKFITSMTFLEKSTKNLEFMQYLSEEKNEQYLELLNIMIKFLKQKYEVFLPNVSAIHILNNLLLRNFHSDIIILDITEDLLISLYDIFDYFLSGFFTNSTNDYIIMLIECFRLMKKQFILTHIFLKQNANDENNIEIPEDHQKLINETIQKIKKIVLKEKINPLVLQKAFKSSTKICKEESTICTNFVEAGFIPICFKFMREKGPAFSEVVDFLGELSKNYPRALADFPLDYPTFLLGFLTEEYPDKMVKSVLKLIDLISFSVVAAKKMIELNGFLEILLNNDRSFRIRMRSLKLFDQLMINYFNDMEKYFIKKPDLNFFNDYFDTESPKIIFAALKILSHLSQNACYRHSLPEYMINFASSHELLDRINSMRDDPQYNDSIQEAAALIMTSIEHLINSYELDIPFDYEIKYGCDLDDDDEFLL